MPSTASLQYERAPDVSASILVAAFAGWPDASEGATRAVKLITEELSAQKFATVDPEDFYNFTEERPAVRTAGGGERVLDWPSNEFFAWKNPEPEGYDVVFLAGTEPHLRWRTYTQMVHEVALECSVELVVTLGALLDAVPHTRPVKVSRSASSVDLGPGFQSVRYDPPTYEGPAGIMSVLLERMTRNGIPSVSFWGHAPHYVQASPNPNVTRAILQAVPEVLPVSVDTSSLDEPAEEFNNRVDEALADQDELKTYLARLESKWDEQTTESTPAGDQGALMNELEEFLRQQQSEEDDNEDEGDAPGV
ncbi:MAG: PAC2 family protein [Chloroflexota bacterium]